MPYAPSREKNSQRPSDQLFHDFIRPRVDPLRAAVGPHAGNRVLHHVTVTAVQLHACIDDAAFAFGEPILRHRCRYVVELAGDKTLDATIEEDPADARLRHALRELEARILKIDERLAESSPVL